MKPIHETVFFQPVLSRFDQVKPKVLITVDRFKQAGEEIEMLSKVKTVAQGNTRQNIFNFRAYK